MITGKMKKKTLKSNKNNNPFYKNNIMWEYFYMANNITKFRNLDRKEKETTIDTWY